MTLAIVAGILAAAPVPVSSPAPKLVRFTCDERVAARRAERAWSAAAVVDELAHGWNVVVREACEHAEEFERLVGERGVLAACVLDSSGGVIGILRGPAEAERCADFLAACRAETGRESELLARIDARIALGAWSAARAELRCLVGPQRADTRLGFERASLLERRARTEVLQGDVASASCSLDEARRAGIDAVPVGRTRAAVTATWIALAARRVGEARERLPRVLAALEDAPCERAALLGIADMLHECGADGLALDVCAALETTKLTADTRRSIAALREHVLLGTNGHDH
ncbi:MAG: hypothetical protein HZA53_15780 [Planctomycetes bacterium]|nr:hypothetical protein [Planctomycetota bacterium]